MTLTDNEARAAKFIVEIADENGFLPEPFRPHLDTVQEKLHGGEQDVTPAEASALLATTWAYLQRADTGKMSCLMADTINSYWGKLQKVTKGKPVFIYAPNAANGPGWYTLLDGGLKYGPYDDEDRARFNWEIKPWTL